MARRSPNCSPRVEVLEGRLLPSAGSILPGIAAAPVRGRIGPPTTTTSGNWSGYAVETDFSNPQTGSVSAVGGEWVVPAVTGTRTAYSAAWVGIDGYSSSTVEQLGTEQDVIRGTPVYYAWYEMYPAASVTITTMPVHPGDVMSAEVSYSTASGQFTLQMSDTPADGGTPTSFSINKSLTNAKRSSAEWIMEKDGAKLADFGTASFLGSWATLDGVTGPIDDTAWQNVAIDIAKKRGSVLDTTSALTDATSGGVTTSSFTITYGNAAAIAVPPTAATDPAAVLPAKTPRSQPPEFRPVHNREVADQLFADFGFLFD